VKSCGICGFEGTEVRRVTRSFGKGNQLLIIENIPYVFCPHCGERYFTAATLREIERIRMSSVTSMRRRRVPVFPFRVA
jgi:YgiT-type zinc finger domain-containing protein